jgi:hypothetical protein
MDGLIAAAVVVVAALLVLLAFRQKQAAFKGHVQTVSSAAKPKRQLVIGTWSREEVAKHASADDLWLIIQVGCRAINRPILFCVWTRRLHGLQQADERRSEQGRLGHGSVLSCAQEAPLMPSPLPSPSQDQRSKEWRVYDMTDYVDEHPGGMAIMYNAGGDATQGFHGPQHPPTVFDILGDYCIGTLADP